LKTVNEEDNGSSEEEKFFENIEDNGSSEEEFERIKSPRQTNF